MRRGSDSALGLALAYGMLALLLLPRGHAWVFFAVMLVGAVLCGRLAASLDLPDVEAALLTLPLVVIIHGLAFWACGDSYPLKNHYLGGAVRDTAAGLVVEWILAVQVGMRTRGMKNPPGWLAWGAVILVMGASILGPLLAPAH